jgi:hypothetical protein
MKNIHNTQTLLIVLLLVLSPLRIREAVAQTTPLTSAVEEQNIPFDLAPKENPQLDNQADTQLPQPEKNPRHSSIIDAIGQLQVDDDMWRQMRAGLPCSENSATCLQQLQDQAIAQSPLLREIDHRIAEANETINQARAKNQKSIQLAALTPALQYILGAPQPGQPQPRGNRLIDHVLGIIRGDTGLIQGLLRVVSIPFFNRNRSVNTEVQRQTLPITDIQVKVDELHRGRAKLVDEIRENVALSLSNFAQAKTDFQTAQSSANRAIDEFKDIEIRFVQGNYDPENYLLRQNQLENTKAQTYRSWMNMRRALFDLKLLVLNIKDVEI